jgi:hypothetical protein
MSQAWVILPTKGERLIFLGAYTDLIYFLLEVWDSHLNLAVCCCDHCRGCMLKKVWSITGSAGIGIFAFSFGSCFKEPFTNAFVMIFLVIIWDYHVMSLNALLFDYPYKCYLLFVYFILLHLDLVSASSPQHQEQKSLRPLAGWYDLEMHVWHLMNLSSFSSYIFA